MYFSSLHVCVWKLTFWTGNCNETTFWERKSIDFTFKENLSSWVLRFRGEVAESQRWFGFGQLGSSGEISRRPKVYYRFTEKPFQLFFISYFPPGVSFKFPPIFFSIFPYFPFSIFPLGVSFKFPLFSSKVAVLLHKVVSNSIPRSNRLRSSSGGCFLMD